MEKSEGKRAEKREKVTKKDRLDTGMKGSGRKR
jgi:hypothetical protein